MAYNPYAPQQGQKPNAFTRNIPGAPGAPGPASTGNVYASSANGQGTTNATTNTPATPDPTKTDIMFDPENPQGAIRNALIARGINPFNTGNAVTRRILSAAPGLGNSFLMRSARGETGGGTTAESIDAAGGIGNMFKNFLSNVLSGGGAGVHEALRQFGSNNSTDRHTALNSISDIISADQKAAADNPAGSVFNGNIFAEKLFDMLKNDPTSGAGMIASLYSPFMTQGMSQTYGNQMNNLGYMAPSYYNPDDPADNPFNYLLGHRPAY